MEPTPDPLLIELSGRLPALVEQVLSRPQIADQVAALHVDGTKLAPRILAERDDLLKQTNPQIAALREARRELDAFTLGSRRSVIAGVPGIGVAVIALWLAVAAPAMTRQVWDRTPSGFWWGLASLIVAIVLFGLAVGANNAAAGVVARGLNDTFDKTSSGDFGLSVSAMAYTISGGLLVASVLVPATDRHLGLGLTLLIWITLALVWMFVLVVFGTIGLPTPPAATATGESAAPTETSSTRRAAPKLSLWRSPTYRLAMPVTVISAVVTLAASTVAWWNRPWWHTWHDLVAIPAALVLVYAGLALVVVGEWLWLHTVIAGRRRDIGRTLQGQVDRAVRQWEQEMTTGPVPEAARRKLAELHQPSFSQVLTVVDASGLLMMSAQDRVVVTPSFADFGRLIADTSGGAIGVAGTRGTGKSTLLGHYRDGRLLPAGTEHVSVYERIPVRYEPREFALYLYATVCEAVIGFVAPSLVVPTGALGSAWRAVAKRAAPAAVILTWLLLAAGTAEIGAVRKLLRTTPWWLNVGLAFAFAVLVAVTVVRLTRRRRRVLRPRPIEISDPATLVASARQRLDVIQFEQRFTSGWSGKLGLLLGGETSLEESIESTARSMAYPDVVKSLHAFLAATVTVLSRLPKVGPIPIVIILDELDKITDTAHAQEFINEIKSLFAVERPGCLFLVSVSEDALAAFENRGLPVRDAFDSAFDTIFELRELTLTEAREVLLGRVPGLPTPYTELAYCLAGGLPRDLIRVARAMVTHADETLPAVSSALVGDQIRLRLRAYVSAVAACTDDEPHTSRLLRHLTALREPHVTALLAAVSKPPIPADVEGPVTRFQLEALAFLYYCATLLEVFDGSLTESKFRRAQGAAPDAALETLAQVRAMFSINVRLAWLTLNSFRAAWGLTEVEAPQ